MRALPWLLSIVVLLAAALLWWGGDGARIEPRGSVGGQSATGADPADDASEAGVAADGERRAAVGATVGDRVRVLASGLCGRLLVGDDPAAGVVVRAKRGHGPLPDGEVVTAGDGSFSLPLEPAAYDLTFSGGAAPRGVRFQRVLVPTGTCFDLGEVRLPRRVSAIGRIVDADGRPIAAVRVYARGEDESFHFDVVDPASPAANANVCSDERGRFVVEGLAHGAVTVRAEAAARRPLTRQQSPVDGDVVDFGDLVMLSSEPLRGFVLDAAGAPAADVEVIPGGGGYDTLEPRFAVRTGDDGGFSLAGFGETGSVTLRKPGFAPTVCERVDARRQPVQLRIEAAQRFYGVVRGIEGRDGTITIDSLPGDHHMVKGEAGRFLHVPQPLAADGSFDLAHVPAGRWGVSARAPGVGSTPVVEVVVPLEAPLELTIVPGREVRVRCVDGDGAPFAGVLLAQVVTDDPAIYGRYSPSRNGRTWFEWGVAERTSTDDEGRTLVRVPAHQPLMLAATFDRRQFTSCLHVAGQVPDEVELVLPRTGALRGRVADAALTRHGTLWAWLDGETAVGKRAARAIVDANGRFDLPGLLPGHYVVRLTIGDCSSPYERGVPRPAPLPIVTDEQTVAGPVEVEVRVGELAEVELPAPVVGRLEGRVLAGGRPVHAAIVYADAIDPEDSVRDPNDLDCHRLRPHCTTDAEGRFTVLVAQAADFVLRARGASAPAWSPGLRANVALGATVAIELALPAATVRGSYDMSAVAKVDRAFCEAQLYPIGKAGEHPFLYGHETLPLAFDMQQRSLGDVGVFAFEGLQPGTWVLRIVSRHDEILVQRVVRVVGDELLDLGRLEPLPRVQPRVRIGPGQRALRVALVDPDAPEGVFAGEVARRSDGSWTWPPLEPGTYLVQPLDPDLGNWTVGGAGWPVGEPKRLIVHADGSTTPTELWTEADGR